VDLSTIIEDALGNRGFAGINVGNNPEITDGWGWWMGHDFSSGSKVKVMLSLLQNVARRPIYTAQTSENKVSAELKAEAYSRTLRF
jgi:hypothetical protein